ncbi:MAG: hypothetical protein HY725_00760 [Candidatus Rokubacteria bacterium]|nr:hypothetical protein [Candidatus Rokubacteria bacterium]
MTSIYALVQGYLIEAWPFACMHALLIVACGFLWAAEFRRLQAERFGFEEVKSGDIPDHLSTEIGRLTALAFSLVEKNRLLDAATIRDRLTHAIMPSDGAFRVCLNGFIVVGLLGTLYNLWYLGPDFWISLVQRSEVAGDLPINVAFLASIFGLVWALLFGLVDSFVVQPRRDAFVRKATDWLVANTSSRLFPPAEAVLAQSLTEFKQVATAALRDSTALTKRLAEHTEGLADRLTTHPLTITAEWTSGVKEGVEQIRSSAETLGQAAEKLGEATLSVSAAADVIVGKIGSLKDLSEVLGEIRDQGQKLFARIESELQRSSETWRLSQQAAMLERQAHLAEARLTDLMDKWHTGAAEVLQRFAVELQRAAERFDFDRSQAERLIATAEQSLARSVSELRSSLGPLEQQRAQLSAVLSGVCEELRNMSQGTRIVRGQPFGSAIQDDNLAEVLRGLSAKLDRFDELVQGVERLIVAVQDRRRSGETPTAQAVGPSPRGARRSLLRRLLG